MATLPSDKAPLASSRRRWRFVPAIGATFAAFASAAFAWVYLLDEPLQDDSDLLVSLHPVPDAQNGYVQLRKIDPKLLDFDGFAEKFGASQDTISDASKGDFHSSPVIAAFLAQAQPAFTQLDACLAQPYFQFPGAYELVAERPEFDLAEKAIGALNISARQAEALGNLAAATRDIVRLRQFARRLAEGNLPAIGVVIATYANNRATPVFIGLYNDPALTPSEVSELTASYNQEINWRAALQRAYMQEYHSFLTLIAPSQAVLSNHRIASLGLTGRLKSALYALYICHPNATRNQAAAYYRSLRHDLYGPYVNFDPSKLEDFPPFQLRGNPRYWIFLPNVLGRSELAVQFSNTGGEEINAVYDATACDRLTLVGLALRRYYNDHGTLPTTLAKLVPDYIPAIPLDPFNDQPLRFDPAHERVSSVGSDQATLEFHLTFPQSVTQSKTQ